MIRKFFAGVMVAAVFVAPMNASAFGLPKIPGADKVAGGGGGSGAADVDKFLAEGATSTALFMDAQTALAMALTTKDKRAEIKNKYDVVKKGLAANDKKAGASQQEFLKSNDALIAEQTAAAGKDEQLKNLSADQKKLVGSSLVNLGLAVLAQKQQIDTGTKLVSSISADPMMASKALALKDSVSTLTANVSMGASYVSKLPSLFKTAGISVAMPTDASTKPAEMDFSVFDEKSGS